MLPVYASSLTEALEAEASVAADAISVGNLAQEKLIEGERRERLILLARRVWALDVTASLVLLLPHEEARHGAAAHSYIDYLPYSVA